MYKIRLATEEDAKECVLMGVKFYQHTEHYKHLPYDLESLLELFHSLHDEGFILVVEHDCQLVGMLGVLVSPSPFNKHIKMGTEIILWLDPEHRKGDLGSKMIRQAEACAVFNGVSMLLLGMLTSNRPGLAAVYERQGFVENERMFVKHLEVE